MSDKSLFETVIASTVHDMKNSLSLLMGELDSLSEQLSGDKVHQKSVADIRYESSRINFSLMQLLALYRLENKQLKINMVEVEVIEFIEDCVAVHTSIAAQNEVQIDIDCDESLVWFFDPNLAGIAINNILGNSIRYTKSRILISVSIQDDFLLMRIDDDGRGYPENMLQNPGDFSQDINIITGSTGLGLLFSSAIAKYHQKNDRAGKIDLANNGLLSGGCFKLFLP